MLITEEHLATVRSLAPCKNAMERIEKLAHLHDVSCSDLAWVEERAPRFALQVAEAAICGRAKNQPVPSLQLFGSGSGDGYGDGDGAGSGYGKPRN